MNRTNGNSFVEDLDTMDLDDVVGMPAERGAQYHPSEGVRKTELDSTPDELTEMLNALDSVKEFWVNVFRIDNGKKVYCGKKCNLLPDPHAVGEEYGSGDFILTVSWPVPGQKPPRWKNLRYTVDRSYDAIHRDWLALRNPVSGPNGGGFESDLERMAKIQNIFGGSKKDDSDSTKMVLEFMRETNRAAEKRLDKLEEQIKEDRKETRELMKNLLEGIKSTVKPPEQRSLVHQIEEIKAVAGHLGLSSGNPPPESDDRPAWMQAVDLIGDKVAPLLTAFAQSRGLKRSIAEGQVNKALDASNPIVAKIMQDREQQVAFIREICSKADTPEKRLGAYNLAAKMQLVGALPPGFAPAQSPTPA